jgi:hypothetical protein
MMSTTTSDCALGACADEAACMAAQRCRATTYELPVRCGGCGVLYDGWRLCECATCGEPNNVDAFREGAQANEEGVSRDHNPYAGCGTEGAAAFEWRDGWDSSDGRRVEEAEFRAMGEETEDE